MNQQTSRVAWTSLGLLSLVLCVYLPVIAGGGFFWDDHVLLLDNRLVWSPGGLFDIWFSTKNPDYFPLMSTSFWLEARLWGREAWGYHLVNALLHAGSAILLWRIFTRLKIRGALLGAILFAVTPLNVESVAWVAERKNTLSMFFACGSVLLWLRGEDKNDRRAYAGALLFFAASLLAKTAAVMLPFVLLVLAWHRRGKITARDALRAAPFFALSLALGLVTIWFQYHRAIGHDVVIRDDPFPARLATAGCAVWFYLAKALVPINLTFNYPRWSVSSYGALGYLPAVALAAAILLLWRLRRTALRPLLTTLTIYLLLLLPMLGFLNIFFMRYSLVSDHWQYHASAAIYALLGGAGAALWQRSPARSRQVCAALLTLLVLLLMGQSLLLAATYRRADSIWRDTLARNPAAWLAESQLGMDELAAAGDDRTQLAVATARLERAETLAPEEPENGLNLGAAYQRSDRLPEALAAYANVLRLAHATPDDRHSAHLDMAAVLVLMNRLDEAEEHIRAALVIEPGSAFAAVRMAGLLARRGNLAAARDWYRRALQRDPSLGDARYALAKLEAQAGDFPAAATQLAILAGMPADSPDVRSAVAQLARPATSASAPATMPVAPAHGRMRE